MRLISLILLVTPALGAQVVIQQQDSKVTVAIDGKPYTEFVYGSGVTKPYLDPLRAASGTLMTRRFPMQTGLGETTDHPEHRGVWFGHFMTQLGAQTGNGLFFLETGDIRWFWRAGETRCD